MSTDHLPEVAHDATPEEPIANPGLPEHEWRPTDVDEHAERRAERQVASLFLLSAVCTVLFVVSYLVFKIGDNWSAALGLGASNVALGLTLGGALLFIGVGIIHWARKLMADHEMVELRHPAKSADEDREVAVQALNDGIAESGIGRRPLIRNSLLGAVGLLGLPAVVLLRDLGPLPGDKLYHTIWGSGTKEKPMRIVRDGIWTPILASDLEIGDLVNCQPDALHNPERYDMDPTEVEGVNAQVIKSKASLVLLRMNPGDIKPGKDAQGKSRENWSVNGIVAYSKICTHVGCPISLNERTTHHLLCPCHQSTFDLADSGKVVFGPAGRPLPPVQPAVATRAQLASAQGQVQAPLALMFATGELSPMPDCAIFSDTGAEPRAVYEWLDWLEAQLPFPVYRIMKAEGLRQNIIDSIAGARFAGAPFFTESQSSDGGQLRRQCTREFKVEPITKKLRELVGLKYRERAPRDAGAAPPRALDQHERHAHLGGGQAGDDVLLHGEEHGDGRQDGQGDEGQDQVPVGRILALVDHDAQRPGIHGVAVEQDERQQIGVPAVHEGDDADRAEDRPGQRQRHIAEELEIAAAVDQRGVEQLGRQATEEVAAEQDAGAEAEGDLWQHHAPIGVEDAEIAHLDEQRQDGGGRREEQAEQQVVEQHAGAEEAQMGEEIGRAHV